MRSAGLLDTPGAQAAGANGYIARGPFQQNAMTRNIQVLAAFAHVVGMTDLIADLRASSADLASRGMCG